MSETSTGASFRYSAVQTAGSRPVRKVPELNPDGRRTTIAQVFGKSTFNRAAMEERLPRDVYKKLIQCIKRGAKLDMTIADAVAHAMKEWALDHGATHFCHWFQPQTGLTAEKHDSFLTIEDMEVPMEQFSGSQLIQGEPDASSFPSGGMRSTFEARGYTAWDPSSPAFLMESPNGKTMCIPSVFISYNGQALDLKTPLLRAMTALNQHALEILKLFGNKTADRVVVTAGPEQEYFLIDRAFFHLRPDLLMTSRSLLGARPAKGQELEDHYFGRIRSRAMAFMEEVEHELYKLGVPAKTRHNEVAPSQCEIAPIFEEANVAADHNQLVMSTLRRVARRHDMSLLIHEKPFEGVNGSGKHVNWSLMDSDGNNLLEPGSTPHENLQFLVFLAAVLKAVKTRAGLLRASIASSGNDHRLGANEAPPAIMSVFLGEQLDRILNHIEAGTSDQPTEKRIIELGISSLPKVSRDNTDRNRTSPFAFTGNKFEFRAVGSSQAISTPLTIISAAMAESCDAIAKEIKQRTKDGKPLERVAMDVVREVVRDTRDIRFEGNNYSAEWVAEAERRGLPNLKTTPEALEYYNRADSKEFLSRYGVCSGEELEARYHINLERYLKDLDIEVETLKSMVETQVLPASMRYLSECLELTNAMTKLNKTYRVQTRTQELADRVEDLQVKLEDMVKLQALLRGLPHEHQAHRYAHELVPASKAVRQAADWLEEHVADDLWPLPKYREMLFVK